MVPFSESEEPPLALHSQGPHLHDLIIELCGGGVGGMGRIK